MDEWGGACERASLQSGGGDMGQRATLQSEWGERAALHTERGGRATLQSERGGRAPLQTEWRERAASQSESGGVGQRVATPGKARELAQVNPNILSAVERTGDS